MGTMKLLLKLSSMMQAEGTSEAPAGKMTVGMSILVTESETLGGEETTLGSNRYMGTKK